MKGWYRTLWLASLPLCSTMAPGPVAHAQEAGDEGVPVQTAPAIAADARTVYIYSATTELSGNKLQAWGNGAAAITTAAGKLGYRSVKVTTRDFYEGARFDLANPIDLRTYQENGSFRLKIHFYESYSAPAADDATDSTPGAVPGIVPGPPGLPPVPDVVEMPVVPDADGNISWPGLPQRRARSVETLVNAQIGLPAPNGPGWRGSPFGGGRGVPGMGGRRGGFGRFGGGAPAQDTPITQMRIALIRDKGMTVGLMPVDLNRVAADEDGWRTFTCPLQPFYSTPDASGPVTSVVLSADQQDDFFLRELALVNESNTISVTIRQASDPPGTQAGVIQVRPGPIALVADIESGTSDTIVEWNFDADNVGNLPPAAFGGGPVKLQEGDATAVGAAGGVAGGAAAGAPGLPGMGGGALPAPGDPNAPPMVAAGPRIDAKGIQARFSYPNEEQNYRVEVTVRDRQGRKAPVKASILVKVRG